MSFVGIGEHLKGKTSLSSIGKLLRRTVLDVLHPLIEMSSKVQLETVSVEITKHRAYSCKSALKYI